MQELVEENCFQEVKAVNILTAPLSCNILEPKPCRMLCSTDPIEGQDLPPMLWPQFIFITFYYFFLRDYIPSINHQISPSGAVGLPHPTASAKALPAAPLDSEKSWTCRAMR
jgi:hypothetical protein